MKDSEDFAGFEFPDLESVQDWNSDLEKNDATACNSNDSGVNEFTSSSRPCVSEVSTKPPIWRTRADSACSTVSSELDCGDPYRLRLRLSSRASSAASNDENERKAKIVRRVKKKLSPVKQRWEGGRDDWYLPQPGEDLEFYLGRAGCLIERTDNNNPKRHQLEKLRKFDEFGCIGREESIDNHRLEAIESDTVSTASEQCDTELDSADSSEPEIVATESTVNRAESTMGSPQSETLLIQPAVNHWDVESTGLSSNGVAIFSEMELPAVENNDGLMCSISRDLINTAFCHVAASSEEDDPTPISATQSSETIPAIFVNQPCQSSSQASSKPETAICSPRPSRAAKLNWKSRLEHYRELDYNNPVKRLVHPHAELTGVPMKPRISPNAEMTEFLIDRYVDFMQRIGEPIARTTVEYAAQSLLQPADSRVSQSGGGSMRKRLLLNNNNNHHILSPATPAMKVEPEFFSSTPSGGTQVVANGSYANENFVDRFAFTSEANRLSMASGSEDRSELNGILEDENDESTNNLCSTTISTIGSLLASDSPLKEGFGLRTLDEQSALTALMSLADQSAGDQLFNGLADGKGRLRRSNGSQLASESPHGQDASHACAGCGAPGMRFGTRSAYFFCDPCSEPYSVWVKHPWHYSTKMKCSRGARCINPSKMTCTPCWFWRCVSAARAATGNTDRTRSHGGVSFEADSMNSFGEESFSANTPRKYAVGGPRTKNVCRSQERATGLPLATFPISPMPSASAFTPGREFTLSALPMKEQLKIRRRSRAEYDNALDRFEERKDYVKCKVFATRFAKDSPYSRPAIGPPVERSEVQVLQPPQPVMVVVHELKKKYKTRMGTKKIRKFEKTKRRLHLQKSPQKPTWKRQPLVERSPIQQGQLGVEASNNDAPPVALKKRPKEKKRQPLTVEQMNVHVTQVLQKRQDEDDSTDTDALMESEESADEVSANDMEKLDPSELFAVKRKTKPDSTAPKRNKPRTNHQHQSGLENGSVANGRVSPSTELEECMAQLMADAGAACQEQVAVENMADLPIPPPKLISSRLLPSHLLNDHCYCAVYDELETASAGNSLRDMESTSEKWTPASSGEEADDDPYATRYFSTAPVFSALAIDSSK